MMKTQATHTPSRSGSLRLRLLGTLILLFAALAGTHCSGSTVTLKEAAYLAETDQVRVTFYVPKFHATPFRLRIVGEAYFCSHSPTTKELQEPLYDVKATGTVPQSDASSQPDASQPNTFTFLLCPSPLLQTAARPQAVTLVASVGMEDYSYGVSFGVRKGTLQLQAFQVGAQTPETVPTLAKDGALMLVVSGGDDPGLYQWSFSSTIDNTKLPDHIDLRVRKSGQDGPWKACTSGEIRGGTCCQGSSVCLVILKTDEPLHLLTVQVQQTTPEKDATLHIRLPPATAAADDTSSESGQKSSAEGAGETTPDGGAEPAAEGAGDTPSEGGAEPSPDAGG